MLFFKTINIDFLGIIKVIHKSQRAGLGESFRLELPVSWSTWWRHLVFSSSEPQLKYIWRICHAQPHPSNHHLPLLSRLLRPRSGSYSDRTLLIYCRVTTDFLSLASFLEKDNLKTSKVWTPEDVDAAVARLIVAIKTAIITSLTLSSRQLDHVGPHPFQN